MARYSSGTTEEPGQYPTTAWSEMGLPEQSGGTGSPGGTGPSHVTDEGSTTEPGQYPPREDFTGVALNGTGAPGTAGIPREGGGGGDSVQFSDPTFYKSSQGQGGMTPGYLEETANLSVSGTADSTQANSESYGPGWNMPGIEGNTPAGGSGQFTSGKGNVMYGGFLKGERPATSRHPSSSGPGT